MKNTFLITGAVLTCTLLFACNTEPPLQFSVDEQAFHIQAGEQPLLTYVHAETPAPEGSNPLYRRSGYIHPLHSPGGMRLTRIQPPDHYHHYGIWAPWTRTRFGDYRVDFWNLAAGEGTVRFADLLDSYQEAEGTGFSVRQEHIYFKRDSLEGPGWKGSPSEGVAMEEFLEISLHSLSDDRYTVDVQNTLRSELENGITLEQYRYGGGIGFRATEAWGPGKATVLTSEGKDWAKADATHARWVIVEGESSVPQGRSGILFMSHPGNQAHPEPMRMWPPDANGGKENIFFEFCPIRHQPWILEAWKDYTLKYRLVVFDGKLSAEEAEAYWKEFAENN